MNDHHWKTTLYVKGNDKQEAGKIINNESNENKSGGSAGVT